MICGSEILRKYIRTRCALCIIFHCKTLEWPWQISTFNFCQDSDGNKCQQNRKIAKLAGNMAANRYSKPVKSQYTSCSVTCEMGCKYYATVGVDRSQHGYIQTKANDVSRTNKGWCHPCWWSEEQETSQRQCIHAPFQVTVVQP